MTAPKPRRRSIRFAIVAVVCLLLGAVTTVGMAWVISTHAQIVWSLAGPADPEQRWALTPPDDASSPVSQATATGCGLHAIRLSSVPWYDSTDTQDLGLLLDGKKHTIACEQTFYEAGWPAPALGWMEWQQSSVQATGDRPPIIDEKRATGLDPIGLPSWLVSQPGQRLPLRCCVRGTLADTALYAAAWYLLIFTPLPLIRAGRRRFRVSRGMCGSCGYDLKGSKGGPCPECGATARGRPT